ncbi:hypothetical protein [Mycoplasma bradburyae]|uniref:hypothetical protein n=1 Tax=Mycoplasma bradburyae TaxID=2963128 RepID=UPI002341054F|nr:hypothetical protein [Mycoplasma bradburyae]MDC4182606.1 hypothetical protein [Mycoplasma bradburyae]
MKAKNIAKLFSLLGITLAINLLAASCNGIIAKKAESINKPNNPSSDYGVDNNANDSLTNAKNQLNSLLSNKDNNINMYADYSVIKSELQSAYTSAKSLINASDLTTEKLQEAKTKLQQAITKAQTDKTNFNNDHQTLVSAYNALKNTLNNKESVINQFSDPKYSGAKEYLNGLYDSAKEVIKKTLQPATGLDENQINQTNQRILDASSADKITIIKANVDSYVDGKLFEITADRFIGDFAKTQVPTGKQDFTDLLIGYSAAISNDWKYAKRKIRDDSSDSNITNVAWIYNLSAQNSKTASYDLEFEYYGGNQATLYFPYKIYMSSQNSGNIGLQYKLNEGEVTDITQITDANLADIKIAEIQLTGLKFGTNKISFNAPTGKSNPIIGNMYIATSNSEVAKSKIYDSLFGIEHDTNNPDAVTVNIVKGYGLANYNSTNIRKVNGTLEGETAAKNYYTLTTLGNRINGTHIRYYTFYVNLPENGNYEISAIYTSAATTGITFWKDTYDDNMKKLLIASIPQTGNNVFKRFSSSTNNSPNSKTLALTKGLNKIIVSGGTPTTDAPDLVNVTFTLKR